MLWTMFTQHLKIEHISLGDSLIVQQSNWKGLHSINKKKYEYQIVRRKIENLACYRRKKIIAIHNQSSYVSKPLNHVVFIYICSCPACENGSLESSTCEEVVRIFRRKKSRMIWYFLRNSNLKYAFERKLPYRFYVRTISWLDRKSNALLVIKPDDIETKSI